MKTKDNIHKIIILMSYIYSYLLIERRTHLYGFSFIVFNRCIHTTE
jgi:hypothetical protein